MNEQVFIQSISEKPYDDELKLVYADWLDDQGDERGQLIRLSVEMRKLKNRVVDSDWMQTLRIQSDKMVKRTEQGWAGHFIAAQSCLFRRNTLLELDEERLIISTVGNYQPRSGPIQEIGAGRYYETMIFWAESRGGYWEADVNKGELDIVDTKFSIRQITNESDQLANNMHEWNVDRCVDWLLKRRTDHLLGELGLNQ